MKPSVLVVGAGLVGTSVGMALRTAGWSVHVVDLDERSQRLAAELGAGLSGAPTAEPDVVVVAVPPLAVGKVVQEYSRIYARAIFTDVSSVKTNLELEVKSFGLSSRFVGGHPMAGRERSGPDAARADLFEGRAWVLCPTPASRPEAVALVADLASACGAQPVQLSAGEHDRAVALVSHAPQLLASAMAGQLVDAPHSELELAGQGLRDSVRIAASDPDLWAEIIAGNATAVADVVAGVARDLAEVVVALRAIASSESPDGDLSLNQYADKAAGLAAGERLRGLLAAGRSGHSRIPGKHGTPAVEYAIVPVVIPDEPGALARLFESTGRAGINVEDLAIEHSPGQPVGLVEISVAPESAAHLAAALAEMGWSVH